MSGSFVAHERNDDERRNGDSLDRNENRIEPKQTSETPIVSSRENLKKPMIVSTAAPVANADATNTIGTSGELRNGTAG